MATFEEIRYEVRQLPAVQQIQLIQELLHELQLDYHLNTEEPASIAPPPPTSRMNHLASDFWSVHDVVDEPNNCFVPSRKRVLKERAVGSSS